MDKNRDGFISKMEMIESSPHLTTSQVDAVFRRNDGDVDGKLSKAFQLLVTINGGNVDLTNCQRQRESPSVYDWGNLNG